MVNFLYNNDMCLNAISLKIQKRGGDNNLNLWSLHREAVFSIIKNCDAFVVNDVSFAEMNQVHDDASNSHYLKTTLSTMYAVRTSYDIIKVTIFSSFLSYFEIG